MLAALAMSLLIIGHRGASGHAPENTLPAFEKAIEMGADGVELDLWPAKDGTPVVIHDEELERTHQHHGKVTAMDVADLRGLDIPSYAQVLELAQGKLVVFTELKGPREDKVAEAIHHAVSADGWSYAALPVISFNHAQLERMKRAHPDIRIGASFSRKMLEHIPAAEQGDFMLTRARNMQAFAINPDYRLVTPELVERAHAAGLQVNVWTVNAPDAMRDLMAMGVDSIMTDYPDRLHDIVHGQE